MKDTEYIEVSNSFDDFIGLHNIISSMRPKLDVYISDEYIEKYNKFKESNEELDFTKPLLDGHYINKEFNAIATTHILNKFKYIGDFRTLYDKDSNLFRYIDNHNGLIYDCFCYNATDQTVVYPIDKSCFIYFQFGDPKYLELPNSYYDDIKETEFNYLMNILYPPIPEWLKNRYLQGEFD